jgi:peptide-methionine (S)-S-oxide reductase
MSRVGAQAFLPSSPFSPNLLLLVFSLTFLACQPPGLTSPPSISSNSAKKPMTKTETIHLAAGCFWCSEAILERVDGVMDVVSGYMGGSSKDPSYQEVCSGNTGHAEVVRVTFDPKKISLEGLLNWFWEMHDPTTLNRQGADTGTQYRSAIFYENDEQKKIAEVSKENASHHFKDPIVTEITKAGPFYPAESYHQDYYRLNREQPYCRAVISPKLEKMKNRRKK